MESVRRKIVLRYERERERERRSGGSDDETDELHLVRRKKISVDKCKNEKRVFVNLGDEGFSLMKRYRV